MKNKKTVDVSEEMLKKIIAESKEVLVQFEGTNNLDWGNAIFVSSKHDDPIEKFISEHEGFFRSMCWPWRTAFKEASYDLDDLMQEAKLIVYKVWNSYDPNRVDILPTTYFGRCILNRFRDMYRGNHACKRKANTVSYEQLTFVNDVEEENTFKETPKLPESLISSVNIHQEIENDDTVETLLKVLNSYERQIVWLTCQGMTQQEIASKFGYSQCSVHNHLYRAIKKMKESNA